MPRLRPLLAMAVLLPACLWTAAAVPAGAAPKAARGEPAMAADAFVDSIGVNVRLGDAAAGWAVADRLAAAGIRHVRVGAATARDDPALPGLLALAGAGLQLDLVAGPDADPAAVAAAAAAIGEGVAAVEATGDAGRLRAAVRSHPELAGVQVLGPGPGVDVVTDQVDLAGQCPGCTPDALGSGDAEVQVTEATVGAGVPDAVAARYLPRLLLGHAGLALRTYLDGQRGPETGPGLFDPAGAPTPAYHALARMIALLADTGAERRDPGRLAFELQGASDQVRHRLLRKADGHFWLALWAEQASWDPAAGRELPVPARRVTVALDTPVAGARAFLPELGTEPTRGFAGPLETIDLEVTDRVLLLELLPGRAARTPTSATAPPPDPVAPASPDQPPAAAAGGQPAPSTTAPATAAGRPPAAAQRPAPEVDPVSRSPLAFTGTTALSMLAASGLLMLVGVAALAASRRRYHHRH
jgi:hypothetical protein